MMVNPRMGSFIALGAGLLWLGTAHATDPVTKCQEAKLKARGKLELCLNKNAAKVLGGKPDASSLCQSKFQDALTKAGAVCRYLDNGDGTVSDLDTGLMWEKKDDLGSIHDKDNLYTWTADPATAPYPPNGTAFTTFLYALNGGTSSDGSSTIGCFANHCDWRVPTIEELRGISLDPALGPQNPGGTWSSSTFAGSPPNAWFGTGAGFSAVFKGSPSGNLPVRAVRSGS
jgi:hypothetical protein